MWFGIRNLSPTCTYWLSNGFSLWPWMSSFRNGLYGWGGTRHPIPKTGFVLLPMLPAAHGQLLCCCLPPFFLPIFISILKFLGVLFGGGSCYCLVFWDGPHPAIVRGYFWLCTLELFKRGSWVNGMLGIEPSSLPTLSLLQPQQWFIKVNYVLALRMILRSL